MLLMGMGLVGGAAGHDLHDLGAVDRRVVAELNAEGCVRGGARLDQLVGDALGLVDRYREAQADRPAFRTARVVPERGDRRVDSNQFAVHVDQCAAGVTGVDRRIGLNGVEHGVLVLGVAARGDGSVHRADDAGGHGAVQTEGRAHRHHLLTNLKVA